MLKKLYAYYASHDSPSETTARVAHKCGHAVVYQYGGTAEYFGPARIEFAVEQAAADCPDCAVVAGYRPPHAPIPGGRIPVIAAAAGAGALAEVRGAVVFVPDEPVIAEGHDSRKISCGAGYPMLGCSYTYVARVVDAASASYLHRDPEHGYTPEEMAWLDEYCVIRLVSASSARRDGYAFGASLTNWYQLEEAERRSGRRIPLTMPCDSQGRILRPGEVDPEILREEERIARQEAAVPLAVEEGQIPGFGPADI